MKDVIPYVINFRRAFNPCTTLFARNKFPEFVACHHIYIRIHVRMSVCTRVHVYVIQLIK